MFILITAPRSDGPERPRVEPLALPQNKNESNQHQQHSGNDLFGGTILQPEGPGLDSSNSCLTPFARRFLESVGNDSSLSEESKDLITKLIFNRWLRLKIIRTAFGQKFINDLEELYQNDDKNKKAQQAEMLTSLIAIPEPTQVIAAINNIKGELHPDLQGLAEGMLASAREFAVWLAQRRAKEGKTDAAMALYQAENVGSPVVSAVTFVQSFVSDLASSYDPAKVLDQASVLADEANKKKASALVVRQEIEELEQVVSSTSLGNPTPEQIAAGRRLSDLRGLASA